MDSNPVIFEQYEIRRLLMRKMKSGISLLLILFRH